MHDQGDASSRASGRTRADQAASTADCTLRARRRGPADGYRGHDAGEPTGTHVRRTHNRPHAATVNRIRTDDLRARRTKTESMDRPDAESAFWSSSQALSVTAEPEAEPPGRGEPSSPYGPGRRWCTPSRPLQKRTHLPASQAVSCGNAASLPIEARSGERWSQFISCSDGHRMHVVPGEMVVRGGVEPPTFRFSGHFADPGGSRAVRLTSSSLVWAVVSVHRDPHPSRTVVSNSLARSP